jgi:hypothetical protein
MQFNNFMKDFVFLPLTGFPRSGSTLLFYILSQNPIFHGGADSELSNLIFQSSVFMRENISHFQLKHELASNCYLNFLRSGTHSWIKTLCPEEKIFLDKSRHWLSFPELIFQLFPKLKIIFTIRDLRGVANSYEKINNTSIYYDRFSFLGEVDVFNEKIQSQRVAKLFDNKFTKPPLVALKEYTEFNTRYKNNVFISKYEDLLENPKEHMNKIYDFLELSEYNHDFENIQQGSYNDNPYLPYGIHKIKNKLEKNQQEVFSELTQNSEDEIVNNFMWFYREYYPSVLFGSKSLFDIK